MNNGADIETFVTVRSQKLIHELLVIYNYVEHDRLLDIIDKLVILGVDINYSGLPFGTTLLMEEVETHNIERVRRLIELGADVNVHNDVGQTALFIARNTGDRPMIKLLLEHNAQVF